jgi:hypothetical protein
MIVDTKSRFNPLFCLDARMPDIREIERVELGERYFYFRGPLPPVPGMPPPETVRFDPLTRCFVPEGAGPYLGPEPLQPDLYLRAAQVNPDAPAEMEAFINEYGSPGVDPTMHHDDPLRALEKRYRHEPLGLARDPNSGAYREVIGAREKTPYTKLETLESVSWGFKSIRLMIEGWMLLSGRSDQVLAKVGKTGESRVIADRLATQLTDLLNDALTFFGPRVFHVLSPENQKPHLSAFDAEATTRPPLFCVLALQLAHAMKEKPELRICKNDLCGRLFTHQAGNRKGRSSAIRHRDAIYCTRECAQRTADRNWKRTKRGAARS